jgi:phosphate transport system ATP-binding protein
MDVEPTTAFASPPPSAPAPAAGATVPRAAEKRLEPPLLRVHKLRVSRNKTPVLKDLSLAVRHGEILSIIGPAGAGKSTFLRSLNRLNDLDPDWETHGEVWLGDQEVYAADVSAALLRQRIGMVFSVPNVLPMSIFRNVGLGPFLAGLPKKEFAARVETALRDAYLWDEVKDRLDEPGLNLSGGQQQRLCLARALALRPDVLLLDEPCSGLDPISTAKIEEALQTLKKDMAVILVTNNVKQASRASDRTAFFLFGEMVELGETAALFTAPKDARTADYITGRFG